MKILLHCNAYWHLWTWLSWRGKGKLPNEHPWEHCVKQWAIIGRFPRFPSTAYCGSSTSPSNSTFSKSGVRIPVKAIPCFQVGGSNPSQGNLFVMWLQWQLISINQSINRKSYSENILHWLTVAESWEKEKSRKNCLDWDSNPRAGNVELELPVCWMAAHSRHTVKPYCREDNRESTLWLPIASHSVPMGVH